MDLSYSLDYSRSQIKLKRGSVVDVMTPPLED